MLSVYHYLNNKICMLVMLSSFLKGDCLVSDSPVVNYCIWVIASFLSVKFVMVSLFVTDGKIGSKR